MLSTVFDVAGDVFGMFLMFMNQIRAMLGS